MRGRDEDGARMRPESVRRVLDREGSGYRK